jgi:hypothetical protein
MTRLNLTDARCEALFASSLQPSDSPTPAVLAEAISRTVRQLGIRGCASRMAQEFGDHPEAASDRMRWIRQLAGQASDCSARPDISASRDVEPQRPVLIDGIRGNAAAATRAQRAIRDIDRVPPCRTALIPELPEFFIA